MLSYYRLHDIDECVAARSASLYFTCHSEWRWYKRYSLSLRTVFIGLIPQSIVIGDDSSMLSWRGWLSLSRAYGLTFIVKMAYICWDDCQKLMVIIEKQIMKSCHAHLVDDDYAPVAFIYLRQIRILIWCYNVFTWQCEMISERISRVK